VLIETGTDGTPKPLYCASGTAVTIVSYFELHARSADMVQACRFPVESAGLHITK